MVQLNTTVYWFIAILATSGLAVTVNDVTSGVNEILSRVEALDKLFNTIPFDSSASHDTIAVRML